MSGDELKLKEKSGRLSIIVSYKNKNRSANGGPVCAQDWIRTSTPFRAPPPQSGASTNFATRALDLGLQI